MKKLVIHINTSQHNPKAMILDLNMGKGQEVKNDLIFAGFVDYGNFKDV